MLWDAQESRPGKSIVNCLFTPLRITRMREQIANHWIPINALCDTSVRIGTRTDKVGQTMQDKVNVVHEILAKDAK